MFQQVVTAQCFKIGISTTLMHDSKYAFPLDTVAEIIIDHSMILKARSNEAQFAGIMKTFDLFICESVNENVFKEFMYYLNKKGFLIEQHDEKRLADFFHLGNNYFYLIKALLNELKKYLHFCNS